MKRYFNGAFVYAIMAMVFGVFYREFTKLNGFAGKTTLSVMHTHYFVLGMFFFLMLLLLEKAFGFSDSKTGTILLLYHTGLNVTGAMFLLRGVVQVLQISLSKGASASLSGIAGIGHILLAAGIIALLLQLKKKV